MCTHIPLLGDICVLMDILETYLRTEKVAAGLGKVRRNCCFQNIGQLVKQVCYFQQFGMSPDE
jgi:hypothetical protein